MTQLDMLVTTRDLQMMKLMLPYLPSSYRGMLAVYFKFTEFQNTLRLFGGFGNSASQDIMESRDIHSPADIVEDLCPFLSPGDAESFEMMMNTINMIKGMNMDDFAQNPDSGEMSDMVSMFDNILKGKKDNE